MMIRNLKVHGLLIVAVLALSATFASAAQAEKEKGIFTGGFTPNELLDTTVVGEQVGTSDDNYFEAGGSKITCPNSSVSLLGTLDNGRGTSLTVVPTYHGCTAAGPPMTTTLNGCDYLLTQPTTVEPLNTGRYTGKVDLTCPTSAGIVMNVYSSSSHAISICKIELLAGVHTAGPPTHYVRELGGHAIYQNETTGGGLDDVKINMTLEGIAYKRSGLCGAKEGSDAVYRTTLTLTGFDDETDPGTTEHTEPYEVWIGHHPNQ